MSEQPKITPGTEHKHDLEQFGEERLREGVMKILQRGYNLTGVQFDPKSELGRRITDSWFEALVGRIPCCYWKEIGIRAAAIAPYGKFTFGQFNQAWQEMVQRGEADGYLSL